MDSLAKWEVKIKEPEMLKDFYKEYGVKMRIFKKGNLTVYVVYDDDCIKVKFLWDHEPEDYMHIKKFKSEAEALNFVRMLLK